MGLGVGFGNCPLVIIPRYMMPYMLLNSNGVCRYISIADGYIYISGYSREFNVEEDASLGL